MRLVRRIGYGFLPAGIRSADHWHLPCSQSLLQQSAPAAQ
jgi:hypothetical protein